MAKYIGSLTSDARGKVAGFVFTRGRNGTNIKGHAAPVNPRTQGQQNNRSTIAASASAWRLLPAMYQTSWNLLAVQYVWTNSLGQTYSPTGLQLFTQAFYNAAQFGVVLNIAAPSSPPAVSPITSYQLNGDGTFLIYIMFNGGSLYSGSFFVSASFPLRGTNTYGTSIRRRFLGARAATDELIATTSYQQQWGILPPAGANISSRIVPVDPTSYISGTVLSTIQPVTV